MLTITRNLFSCIQCWSGTTGKILKGAGTGRCIATPCRMSCSYVACVVTCFQLLPMSCLIYTCFFCVCLCQVVDCCVFGSYFCLSMLCLLFQWPFYVYRCLCFLYFMSCLRSCTWVWLAFFFFWKRQLIVLILINYIRISYHYMK